MTESNSLCPRCNNPCAFIGVSASRGNVYRCGTCIVESSQLLWFWESIRLWESLDEPEGLQEPSFVKVILAARVKDFIKGTL